MHKQEDLYKQFKKGNEHVFALLIEVHSFYPSKRIPEPTSLFQEVAEQYGYTTAFFANFTAHDSVSDMIEVNRYVQKVIDRITPELLKKVVVEC